MLKGIKSDYLAIIDRDPAARTMIEVLLCYPGFHALILYRISNLMWKYRYLKLLSRLLSVFARFLTGVEIHPGATIGTGVMIDHGMGVVIGETTFIGNNVTIFHGVTLGGTGKERKKRHPTIGNDVTLGAYAAILGPVEIGDGVKVGAHTLILQDVPSFSTVVGSPPNQRIFSNKQIK